MSPLTKAPGGVRGPLEVVPHHPPAAALELGRDARADAARRAGHEAIGFIGP